MENDDVVLPEPPKTNEHDVAVAEAQTNAAIEIAEIDVEKREAEISAAKEVAIAEAEVKQKIAEAIIAQVRDDDTWRTETASRMETLEMGHREILSALTEIQSQLSTPTKSVETEPTMETAIPEHPSEGSPMGGPESGEPPEREVREPHPEPRKLRKWI